MFSVLFLSFFYTRKISSVPDVHSLFKDTAFSLQSQQLSANAVTLRSVALEAQSAVRSDKKPLPFHPEGVVGVQGGLQDQVSPEKYVTETVEGK